MRRRGRQILLASAAFGAVALCGGSAQAHFYLMTPQSLSEQDDRGDPQKAPHCGGPEMMSAPVATYTAGETITITIDETIYHPGHYRVALATSGDAADLPDAPEVTQVGMDPCGETTIMDPPVFPVIADGELPHDTPFDNDGVQSFEVTLPDDVECEDCVLQIIQYMSSHSAPCFYYHCARINIESDPAGGSDGGSTGEPDPSTTGDGGTSTSSSTTSSGGDSGTTSGGSGTTGDDDGESMGSSNAGTGTDSGGQAEEGGDDGGCSVSMNRTTGSGMATLALLLLVGLRRRGQV